MADDNIYCSLTEKYKIKKDDEASQNWARLLDFESPIKVESDWYSTETFQVFLDALDINQQPAGKGNAKNSISTRPSAKAAIQDRASSSNDQLPNAKNLNEDKTDSTKKSDDKVRQQQSNFETILSAEALKILSDLPDLSHMSASRSFIFPATITDGAGRSTRSGINSGKR